jgi:hypothetical protein
MTSKKTGQNFVFMIPMGSGPTIYPSLDDSDGHRYLAILKGAEAPVKIDKILAVNRVRME